MTTKNNKPANPTDNFWEEMAGHFMNLSQISAEDNGQDRYRAFIFRSMSQLCEKKASEEK